MNQPSIRTVAAVAIAAFMVYLAIYYWPNISGFIGLVAQAMVPLLLGAVLAYPLNILMGFYERHFLPASENRVVTRMRAAISLAAALLTLIAIVAVVLRLVVPQLIDCVRLLIDELPVASRALFSWLEENGFVTSDFVGNVASSLETFDWQALAGTAAGVVMSGVVGAVSGVVSGTATFVLAFIFALFILLNKATLARQRDLLFKRYLPEPALARIRYVSGIADDCFHRFIVGQCTEAVVLGALCALGMFLLGLPYALMIGALTAFTALIPIVGAFLSGAVGAFLILMVSPVQALIFLVFIVVLQQLEGDFIYPHVVGSSIQLPGIWVLAAVTVGGGAFGIAGMFAGVPLAACAYRLLRNDVYGVTPQ